MTGDYILSIASILIARLKNDDVTIVLSEVSGYSHQYVDMNTNIQTSMNFFVREKKSVAAIEKVKSSHYII